MMLRSRKNVLTQILNNRQLTTLIQPIVDLYTVLPIGYEALTRGPAGDFHSAGSLFKCARSYGLLKTLETACLENALTATGQIPVDKKVFININPLLMAEITRIRKCFTLLDSSPGRIVFEITEHVKVQDFMHVSRTCRMLKERGFLIAIDDVGSGYDRLRSVAELRPDFIKIDRPIVSGALGDKQYQAIVKHLVALGAEIKCSVIAEGIETAYELAMMKKLGVTLGQGFFFSRPVQLKEIQKGADNFCQAKGL